MYSIWYSKTDNNRNCEYVVADACYVPLKYIASGDSLGREPKILTFAEADALPMVGFTVS